MLASPFDGGPSAARRQLFAVIAIFCLLFQQSTLVASAQTSARRNAADQAARVTPQARARRDPSFANPTSTVFINEILYDITGTDAGEFVEVAAPAGTNMANYSIVLYNGSGGAVYDTDALSGTTTDQQGGYGFVSISYPSNGIQNGSPDGIALINTSTNTLVQFLCYEGTFAGVGGLANGVTCTDIGVSQSGTNAAGTSLQLQGTGTTYGNFTWNATSIANTQNAVNTGQTFTGGGGQPTLNINDVTQAEGNAGTTIFNFTASLTTPAGLGGVTFTINTADGTTNPANAGSDYVAIVDGPGSIAEGSSSTPVSITVNGDSSSEPNETFFVNISNITGANAGDVQGLGTISNDDFTLTPIHDIQGSGSTSPLATMTVTTTGIVTGLRSNGFFLQAPEASYDANSETSEGIFVFTSSAPPAAAAIGNSVQVSGTVQEFSPPSNPVQRPLTELSGAITVSLLATGEPLPAPVVLTPAETTAPSETANSLETLEEYEGMRVTIPSMTVIAPTDGSINEPNATVSGTDIFYGVVTGVARPFREPGINISDPVPAPNPPNVPRFDENPERIRIDSDGQTGAAQINVTAGTILTNVTGPLDYAFRTWSISPDAATPPTIGTLLTAIPVPVPNADDLTIGSFNMQRFFDTTDDPGGDPVLTPTAFNNRLNKASLNIRNVMRTPDVIGVVEMEHLSTLQTVATKVNNDAVGAGDPNPNYQAFLVEGNDIGGIDVGFLVKGARVSVVDVTQIEQPGCDHVTPSTCFNYINPNDGQPDILNDRPPLVLRATVPRPAGGTFAFTVIVNHLRSLSGVDDPVDGNRIRTKRRAQAEFLANYIQSRQTADATERIISVGDYNAFQFNDGFVDLMGTIKGTPTAADQVVLPSSDLVNPNLTDLIDTATPDQRYSFTFDGNAQALDHVLVNEDVLTLVNRYAYGRTDADFPVAYYQDGTRPERISDHDPAVVYISLGVPQPQGSVIISEFRLRGPDPGIGTSPNEQLPPAEATNEFIEIYNNTDSNITVSTTDGSLGWAVVSSNGSTVFEIPTGTVIPARGHYLGTNVDSYTLEDYGGLFGGSGDASYSGDTADNGGVALFRTSNPLNFTLAERLDAVGYSGADPLYREGSGLPTGGPEFAPGVAEFSFFRDMRTVGGVPKDTGNNAADFLGASVDGLGTNLGPRLGAPGPENLFSPVNRNSAFGSALLDPGTSSASPPNRVRKLCGAAEECLPGRSQFGTMSIRRTFTNNTGAPVSKLRFRVMDITTFPPPGGIADLRPLSSSDIVVMVGGNPVDVRGTQLEAPPGQPNGGGWNSSLNVGFIDLATPLDDGQSVSVQFLVGVQQLGSFRIFINVEALDAGQPVKPDHARARRGGRQR